MSYPTTGHGRPARTLCAERERLRTAFTGAVRRLAELQHQQTEAVFNDDPDFLRFDDLIHMAKLDKDHAKYALLAHLSEHGCHDHFNLKEAE